MNLELFFPHLQEFDEVCDFPHDKLASGLQQSRHSQCSEWPWR